MFGREATEEMEITDYNPPHSYHVGAQSHGVRYHTTVAFNEVDPQTTEVTMEFSGKPLSLGAKLFMPLGFLMMGSVRKALRQDILDLKHHLES